tara:strand:+ start:13613 stop:14602 length:990 start_codon:yes stop_codon:yes gene_type:complete
MSFLDNSGDIILDAVLTDTGRMRLAKGDGSFKIDKFALGDDEIDYGLYDKNNASGSAYYDLSILQTPVLEAFTNNMSSMKSRLLTVNDNDLLYLPVIKLFTQSGLGSAMVASPTNSFVVPVDKTTVETGFGGALGAGILNGYSPSDDPARIELQQGLNTNELAKEDPLSDQLIENQYIIQIDNRLGQIFPAADNTNSFTTSNAASNVQLSPASFSFVDDDSIANYYFVGGDQGRGYVSNLRATEASSIAGPRGTKINFRIGASLELRNSDYLFTQLGTAGTANIANSATSGNDLNFATNPYRFIDSTVRISGVNTGYSVDIPVRFVKLT